MTPKEMVTKACVPIGHKGWFTSLSNEDKEYVIKVVAEMKKADNFMPYIVASLLRAELDLTVSRDVIARKIKELFRDA